MKKLSNLHKKVLNIAVTLLAAITLILGNVTSVAAYTDINGYPLIWDDPGSNLYIYDSDWNYITNYHTDSMTLQEQNAYLIDYDINFPVTDVREIRIGTTSESLVIPINLDVYDYYLVGTVAAINTSTHEFGDISNINIHSYDTKGNLAYVTTVGTVGQTQFFNNAVGGRSFYAKIDVSGVCNIGVLTLQTGGSTINGDIWFSASVVPVPKSGTEADTLNSILQTLTQINQNIITGNTLQQQTIDAINQNTTNTTNWFSTLISNLSTWYSQRKEDLSNWFLDIDTRLSSGFAALYSQMTKEQNEQLYGYQESVIPDASEEFNTGASELGTIEEELSGTSSQYVNDYTAEAYDVSLLDTLGPSLVFVVTWFTNFWNMGGAFTACLTLCFAMFIAFYVLRTRK